MPRKDSKQKEHKLGSTVMMKLPVAYGGTQKLKVVVGNSCEPCVLKGLGNSHCKNIVCSRYGRSDGQSINYVKDTGND